MRRTLYWVVLLIALALAPPSAMASSGEDEKAKIAQKQKAATSFAKMANQMASFQLRIAPVISRRQKGALVTITF